MNWMGSNDIVFNKADNCGESELRHETKAVSGSLIRDRGGRQAGKFSRQTGCRTNRGALSHRTEELNNWISAQMKKPRSC